MDNFTSNRILVVDDEEMTRDMIIHVIRPYFSEVDEADDGVAAINAVNRKIYDVILLDMQLPKVSGMEVLAHVHSTAISTPVIILTGVQDVKLAVEAMKQGAYDYLMKPFDIEELLVTLKKAIAFRNLNISVAANERIKAHAYSTIEPVGCNPKWLDTLESAKKLAATDLLIYIQGDTGTGKEVLAQYIHNNSPRKDKPYVVVDCGVIPDSLIESELFGHVKGAFTGAENTKEGLVEYAQSGTIMLDEIGHINERIQQILLKFVETKTFRRIGDTETRTVDVRIIVATNKDLEKEVEHGRFRIDLWYRLNGIKLIIPPLCERPEDIPLLANYFLQRFNRNGIDRKRFSSETLDTLCSYKWPGNIRELQSVIQRACALSRSEEILADELGLLTSPQSFGQQYPVSNSSALVPLREIEMQHIKIVLDAIGWNISKAAKILGIGRVTLHTKIKEYVIKKPREID
jgi:two-component system, NtrC family, response regulator AtoC